MPSPPASSSKRTSWSLPAPDRMRRHSSTQSRSKFISTDDIERGPAHTPSALPTLHGGYGGSDDEFDGLDEDVSPSPPHRGRSELPASALSSKIRKTKTTRIAALPDSREPRGLRVHWAKFKRRMGTGTAPSTSELEDGSQTAGSSVLLHNRQSGAGMDPEKAAEGVDEVVVDRSWFDEIKSSVVSQSEGEGGTGGAAAQVAGGLMGEKLGPSSGNPGTNGTDRDSTVFNPDGFWGKSFVLVMLRYRMWPAIVDFFTLHFDDPASEDRYRKETWFLQKTLSIWSAFFLIMNWVLTTATLPSPVIRPDRIFFYGLAPVLSVGVLPMVMWDWPRDRPVFYQIFVCLSVWSWTFFNLFSIYFCGFYIKTRDPQPYHPTITCGNKDFLGTLFFVTALPTIGLFGLRLRRLPQLIGVLCYFVVGAVLILRWKTTWYRNILQSVAFHIFLMWVHYMRENAERRLYILRDQLKLQYKATQKAQINERKTAESKRRLTSYVFHEVRVPLNTATLAVQNMSALGTLARGKGQDIEFKALEGSLAMMSKVLNDVLDFNRMDSGRFESVHKPYAFHHVLRSLLVPLRMATDARKLRLVTDLDESIDIITRVAAYQALGESPESIRRRLIASEGSDESGMVVGDEMRLRQIINNLASNACKFTPAGGTITVRTRLLWPSRVPDEYVLSARPGVGVVEDGTENGNGHPRLPLATPHPCKDHNPLATPTSPIAADRPPFETRSTSSTAAVPPSLSALDEALSVRPPLASRSSSSGVQTHSSGGTTGTLGSDAQDTAALHAVLSARHLDQHNARRAAHFERVVVRIEVEDTGCGISGGEMVKDKLFSAFNQTEQGRQQGGKGTGLGLALVRQIVKRSGGRLGVVSKGVGMGSTFWVELPLDCGAKAIVGGAERMHRLAKIDIPEGIDPVFADLTVRSSRRPRPTSMPSATSTTGAPPSPTTARAMEPATLESIMDHEGKMASLPGSSMDSAHPILARMAINDAGGSPLADAVSLNMEHMDNGAHGLLSSDDTTPIASPPAPSTTDVLGVRSGYGIHREAPPPPIKLPSSPPVKLPGRATAVSTSPKRANTGVSVSTAPLPFAQMPVLVVDDDSLTRMLMKRLLTRLGCKVTTAEDGAAALALITGNSPRPTPQSEDVPPTPEGVQVKAGGSTGAGQVQVPWTSECRFAVVFLDNQMPVLSGLEAVARLRALRRNDFVVGVTGNALQSDQDDYLEAGADYVLTKPVLEKSLRGMLVLAQERKAAAGVADEITTH